MSATMDPAASIDRLSTSIAQLSVRVDKFGKDVHDAKQDMDDLSEKLAILEDDLETLERDFENPAVQYPERQKKNLRRMVDDCDRITKEMVTLLTSLSSDDGDVAWSGFSKTKMADLQRSLEADISAIAVVISMKQLSNAEQDRLNRAANSTGDTESMLSVPQSLLETAPVPYAKEDPHPRAKHVDGEHQIFFGTRHSPIVPPSKSNDRANNDIGKPERINVLSSATLITESPVDLRSNNHFTRRPDPEQDRDLGPEDKTFTQSWFEDPFTAHKRLTVRQDAEMQRENGHRIPDDWTNRQLMVAPIEQSGEGKEVVPSNASIRSERTLVSMSEATVRKSTYVPLEEGKLDEIAMTAAAKARGRLSDSEQKKADKELLKRVKEGAERSKIESLLDRGADPNASGPRNTVLTTEIQYSGRQQVIELLLSRGAEPNATSDSIPDHKIIEGGNMERFKSRLGTGRSIDAVPYKVGVLFLAALHRNIDIVKLLVTYGAAVRPYSDLLPGPQRSFSPNHRPSIDRRNSGSQPGSHRSAILVAAENDKWDIVHFLLMHGADPNETGGKFETTLQIATVENKKDIMQMLIDRGADVNVQGGQYWTALIAAAFGGHPNAARILLDAGAHINVHSKKFGTALNAAVLVGNLQVVKLLLARGADTKIGYVLDVALQKLKEDPENSTRKAIRRALEDGGAKPGPVDQKAPEYPGLF